MNLYFEPGTKVKVTFVDGQILTGIVDHWTPPGDSEDNVQELAIRPIEGDLNGSIVGFNESEVKKIERITN